MTNTNITNLRKNLFEYVNQAIEYNDVINVNTKNGNVILMSEEEYNGLIETLYLSSNPKAKEEIVAGMQAQLEDCIPADEVEW